MSEVVVGAEEEEENGCFVLLLDGKHERNERRSEGLTLRKNILRLLCLQCQPCHSFTDW
jgi:hypothetical protein